MTHTQAPYCAENHNAISGAPEGVLRYFQKKRCLETDLKNLIIIQMCDIDNMVEISYLKCGIDQN